MALAGGDATAGGAGLEIGREGAREGVDVALGLGGREAACVEEGLGRVGATEGAGAALALGLGDGETAWVVVGGGELGGRTSMGLLPPEKSTSPATTPRTRKSTVA